MSKTDNILEAPTSAANRELVAKAWDAYELDAPRNSLGGIIRKAEMKRAFYAGAQAAVLQLIKSLAPENDEEDADATVFQEMHDELCEFKEKVLRGEA